MLVCLIKIDWMRKGSEPEWKVEVVRWKQTIIIGVWWWELRMRLWARFAFTAGKHLLELEYVYDDSHKLQVYESTM